MAACIEQEQHQQQQQQQQQHPVFKHYCRVCKKGFMCGRALGGHMRAHGIGDESGNLDDDEDDPVSDWEEKGTTNNKRMYKLRTNPNRLKSVRVCENCGQEFFSWKSFLEHGKCGSGDDMEEEESLVSSPGSDADESFGRRGHGWSKRKRSLRAKVESNSFLSSEDEDLLFAKCLVDLANARVYSPPQTAAPEPEESSCASASKEFLPPRVIGSASANKANNNNKTANNNNNNNSKGLFECKACKKVFTSHQALGGHRASHKKVKGCYAAKQDLQDNNNDSLADDDVITHEEFMPNSKSSYQFEPASRRKSKVHECSICHRVFSTGQALGGHKRCHWITSNTTYSPAAAAVTKISDAGAAALDLNLPAAHGGGGDMSRLRNPSLNFEVSTEIQLHRPWYNDDNINNVSKKQKNDVVEDDEADSKLKFARISGLKETSTSKGNSSSQWLQVGIGSAPAEIGPD